MILLAIVWWWLNEHGRHDDAWLATPASPSVAYDMDATRRNRVTALEFLSHPAASGPSELVRGEVRVMTPASGAHGLLAGRVFAALNAFVESHGLGVCFPDNTGFELPGLDDTVRSPDAAFIRTERVPPDGIDAGWVRVAPDLIVEILSPSETAASLEEKLQDYRAAGTTLVWVIDPAARIVLVHEAGLPDRRLSASDAMDGGDMLPGFSLPIARLFEPFSRNANAAAT
jgi:Uma2 family endonuclease